MERVSEAKESSFYAQLMLKVQEAKQEGKQNIVLMGSFPAHKFSFTQESLVNALRNDGFDTQWHEDESVFWGKSLQISWS